MKSKCGNMLRAIYCWAVLLSCLTPIVAWAEAPLLEAKSLKQGIQYSSFKDVSDQSEFIRRYGLQFPGARYLRVNFVGIVYAGKNAFSIWFTNGNGTTWRIPSATFLQEDTYSSDVIFGDSVTIEIHASTPIVGLQFSVQSVAASYANVAAATSIVGKDNRQPVALFKDNQAIWADAEAVAKLVFVQNGEGYSCTGFMLDNSTFLTNQHCIADQATCDTAIALFGYDSPTALPWQYRCESLLAVDYNLDFALLKLRGEPGKKWGRIELDAAPVTAGEALYIVQHPGGQPKQVTYEDCKVVDPVTTGRAADSDLSDTCDTLGGSSGSPVISQGSNRVVALHHFGFDSGTSGVQLNRAVRISLIEAKLPKQ